jgi:dihydrolipoamide dehydrogenase
MARTYHTYDLIIIGGGTAGLSALKEAKKHTYNVLLIDDGITGSTSARVNCMTSRSLIHAAKLYDSRKKMPAAGIVGTEQITPDIPSVMQKVREKRDYFISHMEKEAESLKEHIIQGTARYESPTTIRADGRLFHTKASIVATGSSPFIPSKYKEYAPHIITVENIFERKDLPKKMAVIGLGAIGLEMSQALAKLGIDITAIDKNERVGVVSDPDINDTILKALAEDMKIWLRADPDIKQTEKGIILYTKNKETIVDGIFMSAGRTPNLGKLGLKRIGVDTNGDGVPPFNRYTMQIPGQPIYMAGDVTDEHAILHEASDEGRRAAFHALNGDKEHLPRYQQLQVIFTKPVTAVVGDTEYAMRHDSVIVGEMNFTDQAHAVLGDENHGKIRLFADEEGGYFRGAEIMTPAAEHLAHFLAQALTQRLTLEQILKTPFYHPTLEEGLKTALQDALSKIK